MSIIRIPSGWSATDFIGAEIRDTHIHLQRGTYRLSTNQTTQLAIHEGERIPVTSQSRIVFDDFVIEPKRERSGSMTVLDQHAVREIESKPSSYIDLGDPLVHKITAFMRESGKALTLKHVCDYIHEHTPEDETKPSRRLIQSHLEKTCKTDGLVYWL